MTPRLLVFAPCLLLLAGWPRLSPDAADVPAALQAATFTETEEQVRALLAKDGIFVVHFWAPWCHNSMNEFRDGVWKDLIAQNEAVTFIFVTIHNDGDLSEEVLDRYDIPKRVLTFAQPDHGPSNRRANWRTTFLDLPLTWTPTTWIFHDEGELAFAVNYGEVRPALMQSLLDNVRTSWSRH
jgi:hypothetical protein